jgi:hypothetical protein
VVYPEAVGQRRALNEVVHTLSEKYLFKIDAHCLMSKGWDDNFIQHGGKDDILIARFRSRKHNGTHDYFYIDKDFATQEWKPYHGWKEEGGETMSMSGTAWFMHRSMYDWIRGHDESLGFWGNCGVEMALKAWLSGKRVILDRSVVCWHHYKSKFNYSSKGFNLQKGRRQLQRMVRNRKLPHQKYGMDWLLERFKPVPTWQEEERKE